MTSASSVLIGMIAINGELGPADAADAAIEAELGRLQSGKRPRPPGRPSAVDSLNDLSPRPGRSRPGCARPRDDRGGPARLGSHRGTDRPPAGQPAAPLCRHPAADLGQLRRRDAAGRLDPVLLATFGRFLLLWNELTSLAVTDGYRAAERDVLARTVEARRGALQELLGVVATDA